MARVSRLVGISAGAALAAGGWLLAARAQEGGSPPGFTWRTDLVNARTEAAQSGKPLLAVFR